MCECVPPTLASPGLVGVCLAARALKRERKRVAERAVVAGRYLVCRSADPFSSFN